MKVLWGLLLWPFCLAVTQTVGLMLFSLQPTDIGTSPLSPWWLIGGFIFWIFLYLTLPRPMLSYVLAHELTHALWGVVLGARIFKIRVRDSGGSVSLSKSNFLITLAPYFFPLYTLLVILTYYGLAFFVEVQPYEPLWLALIGLTWGFHLTFTISTMMQHQPDIHEHGRVFSYTIIYLFNLLGLGLGIVLVARPTLSFFLKHLGHYTLAAWSGVWDMGWRMGQWAQNYLRTIN